MTKISIKMGLLYNIIINLSLIAIAKSEEYYACQKLNICRNQISSALMNKNNFISPSNCRLIRENLECIFNVVSYCSNKEEALSSKKLLPPQSSLPSFSSSSFSSSSLSSLPSSLPSSPSTSLSFSSTSFSSSPSLLWSLVDTSKKILETKCYPNQGWKHSNCFQDPLLQDCEKFTFLNHFDKENCQEFLKFRQCVIDYIKSKCAYEDLIYLNTYLFDKANNLTLYCNKFANQTPISYSSINDDSSRIGEYYPTFNTYPGYLTGNEEYYHRPHSIQFPRRDYPPSRFPYENRYDIRWPPRYRPDYSLGSDGYERNLSIEQCIEKVRFLVRTCEETYIQSRKFAHSSSTPYEVQKDLCCALMFYEQCVIRTIQRICPTLIDYVYIRVMPLNLRQELEGCNFSIERCYYYSIAHNNNQPHINIIFVIISIELFFTM